MLDDRDVVPALSLRRPGTVVLVATLIAAVLATVLGVRAARSSEIAPCERHAADAAARSQVVTGSGAPGAAVTVIGDSWSVGLGLDDLGASWPRELPGRVRVAGFSGSGFSRHASHCGNRAFATRAHAASGAELVIVQGGLNDVDQPAADIRAGFQSLMSSLEDHSVVVVGPASAPSRAVFVQHADTTLANLCREYGVAYIDTSDWDLTYLPDRLHLTPAGHTAFGERVADELSARGLLG